MLETIDINLIRQILANAAGMLREEDGGFMPPRIAAAECVDALIEHFRQRKAELRVYDGQPLNLRRAQRIVQTAWCQVTNRQQPDMGPPDAEFGPDYAFPQYDQLPGLLFSMHSWLEQMANHFGDKFAIDAFRDMVP